MTGAAQQLLTAFSALPTKAKKEVLVGLLREPIEARYTAPTDEQLRRSANALFLDYDRQEEAHS